MEKQYLIWSIEHQGWWLPNERGYTQNRDRAGIYSSKRAHEIVESANINLKDIPNESLVEFKKK